MTQYKCPKCDGSDYYMSNRTVMKGIGGIYGNRGGTKKFPVCRKCDEIMEGSQGDSKLYSWWTRNSKLIFLLLVVTVLDFFGALSENVTLSNITGAIFWLLIIFSIIKWVKNRRKTIA